jgi:hypothetical protein
LCLFTYIFLFFITICEVRSLLGMVLSVLIFKFVLCLPKQLDLFLLILLRADTGFPFLILPLFHIIILADKAVKYLSVCSKHCILIDLIPYFFLSL